MPQIITLGSINMDIVTETQELPKSGETIFGHRLHYIPGGKGSNQAVAASRLHDHVTLVGKLGNDNFGASLKTFLQAEKLNLEHLKFDPEAPTGIALITVDQHSENTIVVVSGSNARITPEDIDTLIYEEDDILLSQFEVPQETILHFFRQGKQNHAITILNSAPAGTFLPELQSLVDYLILNETELAFFAGLEDPPTDPDAIILAAQNLRTHDAQSIIITLGAKGLLCIHQDEVIALPGIAVNAIDTTGAGDCFVGAFAAAIAMQHPLKDTLRFANTAAALSTKKLGASISMPYRKDVDALLAKNATR